MNQMHSNTGIKRIVVLTALFVSMIVQIGMANAQIDETQAEAVVRNMPCLNGLTIDNILKDKIKTRSQRDLGWQIFKQEDQTFDVERAFLMNKSMQIRFRWHINTDGSITAVSSRAQSLCTESSENPD